MFYLPQPTCLLKLTNIHCHSGSADENGWWFIHWIVLSTIWTTGTRLAAYVLTCSSVEVFNKTISFMWTFNRPLNYRGKRIFQQMFSSVSKALDKTHNTTMDALPETRWRPITPPMHPRCTTWRPGYAHMSPPNIIDPFKFFVSQLDMEKVKWKWCIVLTNG